MVFSTFILRYVESKFTLLTYLMENNTVITVISYCTKGLNNSKTKQTESLSLPYTTSQVFNLTEGSSFLRRFILLVFFLRELIFADRGQFAKIKTRKIFMLHGISKMYTCMKYRERDSTQFDSGRECF